MVAADLGGWSPMMRAVLREEQIGCILQDAEQELSSCVTADGRAEFPVAAHIATARKP